MRYPFAGIPFGTRDRARSLFPRILSNSSVGRHRLAGEGKVPDGENLEIDPTVPDADLAERIVKKSLKMGADESECFIQWGWGMGVSVEGGELKRASGGSTAGFGLRILKKGKMGFSYSNSFDNYESTIDQALKLSRISPKRDIHFPGPGKYPAVSGIYDKRIAKMDISDMVELMERMMAGVKDTAEDAVVPHGGGGFGVEDLILMNSSGVEFRERGSGISSSVSCILDRGGGSMGGVSTGGASRESASLDIDPVEIGREAAELALRGIGSRPGPSGDLEVLLTNEAAWELFENVVVPAFHGPDVTEGKTYLHGRTGELIAPDWFSLTDDPLMQGGLGSSPSDDEGVPSRTVPLIWEGVVRDILFDNFSSQKYGMERTSSGVRAERMMGSRSFRNPPTTIARNIVVPDRNCKTREKMIGEMDRGIIIHDILGAHTANRASGDFSVNSSLLFYVEKGEIVHPIDSAMIGGNALDMLSRINCMGTDFKKMGGGMSAASAFMPSMRIERLRVTGSKTE